MVLWRELTISKFERILIQQSMDIQECQYRNQIIILIQRTFIQQSMDIQQCYYNSQLDQYQLIIQSVFSISRVRAF
ncbi:hypothetical protein pb186bvf_016172 [Paramecium bursaria]